MRSRRLNRGGQYIPRSPLSPGRKGPGPWAASPARAASAIPLLHVLKVLDNNRRPSPENRRSNSQGSLHCGRGQRIGDRRVGIGGRVRSAGLSAS
jgi:hypothetical protein